MYLKRQIEMAETLRYTDYNPRCNVNHFLGSCFTGCKWFDSTFF